MPVTFHTTKHCVLYTAALLFPQKQTLCKYSTITRDCRRLGLLANRAVLAMLVPQIQIKGAFYYQCFTKYVIKALVFSGFIKKGRMNFKSDCVTLL